MAYTRPPSRAGWLTKLAGALKKQGLWHLACKKYTQAGDKLRAMKALLRSGDTEKVVFFAGVCRSRDIYVLAANYLQTLAWHTDPELLRAIVDFYGKAKAFESLAAFYEACAAVEIDEFRNYEKATAALREAAKQAGKIKEEALKEARVSALTGARWGGGRRQGARGAGTVAARRRRRRARPCPPLPPLPPPPPPRSTVSWAASTVSWRRWRRGRGRDEGDIENVCFFCVCF
jgi:hypothetical protein